MKIVEINEEAEHLLWGLLRECETAILHLRDAGKIQQVRRLADRVREVRTFMEESEWD